MTVSSACYREIMRFLPILIGATWAIIIYTQVAQAASISSHMSYLPDGTSLAFLAQKTGAPTTPLMDYHSKQMALPASTTKILTALAALLQLGPDFRFTTTLESHNSISGDRLKGDLIARFTGDPTFSRQDMRNMVTQLQQKGVKHIDGNVVIDTSIFASHDQAPGWPWNDISECFSAPPAAAIVDRNCFSVALHSAAKPGDKAHVSVASYYPVNVFSAVRTLGRNSPDAQYCELDVVAGELNRYTLTGCMPQRTEPLPLTFAIQDGGAWAGQLLKSMLMDAGINYSGRLIRQTLPNQGGSILAQIQSAPLHDLLHIMLKKSDNMIADTVFRTIGNHYFNVPGTWRTGSDAVRRILKQKAGIDIGNSVLVDGSGLSRHDLLSPATMMEVLQYIAQNDQQLDFISMLPLSGYDGTLRYRAGLHEAGVDGKLAAKTGSLSGVYNLAGFLISASGQRIAFVQFLSGYAVPPEEQRQRRIPLVRFESRLYRDLYQNN